MYYLCCYFYGCSLTYVLSRVPTPLTIGTKPQSEPDGHLVNLFNFFFFKYSFQPFQVRHRLEAGCYTNNVHTYTYA